MSDNVAVARDVTRDDRQPGRHRLQRRQRQSFLGRRSHIDVHHSVGADVPFGHAEGRDPAVGQRGDPAFWHRELQRHSLEAVTLRPVADQQEPYARTARHQAPERAEQDFVALYRIEPGHTAKHQRVWQKAESPATPRGPLVQLIDVNSVHDDRAPPWPAHAESERLGLLAGRDVDHRVRKTRQ